MKDEISATVLFLSRFLRKNENLNWEAIEIFSKCLENYLVDKFNNHWFPEKPYKGQAYRCIRVSQTQRQDPVLAAVAQKCNLTYEDLKLPFELTIWIDPGIVAARFGEHKGVYCTVASFKGKFKAVCVNEVDIDGLEKKAMERAKQATLDIVNGRTNRKKCTRAAYSNNEKNCPNHERFQHTMQHFCQNQHIQNSRFSNGAPIHQSFLKFKRMPHHHPMRSNFNGPRKDQFQWVNKAMIKT